MLCRFSAVVSLHTLVASSVSTLALAAAAAVANLSGDCACHRVVVLVRGFMPFCVPFLLHPPPPSRFRALPQALPFVSSPAPALRHTRPRPLCRIPTVRTHAPTRLSVATARMTTHT